jgi:hypothetical protein
MIDNQLFIAKMGVKIAHFLPAFTEKVLSGRHTWEKMG